MTIQPRSNLFTSIALAISLLTLAACGGRSTVVTQDDSADYQSAKSLPPLKKPGSPTASSTVSSPTASSTEAIQTAPPTAPVANVPEPVRAEVLEGSNGQVFLQINRDIDGAWRYLRQSLSQSDITVHTRNKSAGRFAIGCAAVDADENVSVTKSGGWSIFRRTPNETEHCSLQVVAGKSASEVRVYDRSGQPVAAAQARSLLTRLLNN